MPQGGEGMADGRRVPSLASRINSPLAHTPLVMLAGRHDETVLSASSFVLVGPA